MAQDLSDTALNLLIFRSLRSDCIRRCSLNFFGAAGDVNGADVYEPGSEYYQFKSTGIIIQLTSTFIEKNLIKFCLIKKTHCK